MLEANTRAYAFQRFSADEINQNSTNSNRYEKPSRAQMGSTITITRDTISDSTPIVIDFLIYFLIYHSSILAQ